MVKRTNANAKAQEIIRCGRDPLYFINNYIKIQHPTKGKLPFKTWPFQDECVNAFQEHRHNVVLKARQLGLSTISSAYVTWMCLFRPDSFILVIATKLDVAKQFIDKCKYAIEDLPEWMKSIQKIELKAQEIKTSRGSTIKAIPTSPDAGRGSAVSLLVMDEAAHIKDMRSIWTGIWPTLSCLTAGTMVLTPDGYRKIEDLCGEGNPGDYKKIDNGLKVWGKHGQEPVSHTYISPKSRFIEVETSRGFKVSVTPEHPLWVLTPEGGKMIPARDLEPGMHLRVDYGMKQYGSQTAVDFEGQEYKVDEDLCYMLGGYTAEGSGNRHSIVLSNIDPEFRDVYLNSQHIKKFSPQKRKYAIRVSSVKLVKLYEKLGVDFSKHAIDKEIPEFIWKTTRENIGAYLGGLFDGNGGYTNGNKTIYLFSSSKKLISQTQLLLANEGIVSSVARVDVNFKNHRIKTGKRKPAVISGKQITANHDSYELRITSSEFGKFFDFVSNKIPRKRLVPMKHFSQMKKVADMRKIPNSLVGSEILNELSRITEENGCVNFKKIYGVGLQGSFIRGDEVQLKRNLTTQRSLIGISEDYGFKSNTINDAVGNYDWQPIKSIATTIKEEISFDFTCPETHSFLQNGILGSNTGGKSIILSTPKGNANKFAELCINAEAGKNKFNMLKLPWSVIPSRDEEWFLNETADMSKAQIAQELNCALLGSGDTFIESETLEEISKNVRPPKFHEERGGKLWIWEKSRKGAQYIISADTAKGSALDYSAFHVIDCERGECCAEFVDKLPPDDFAKVIAKWAKHYNGALVCPESNSYGFACIQALINEGYHRIYDSGKKDINVFKAIYNPKANVANPTGKLGIFTNGSRRTNMLTKMEETLRNGKIETYSSRLLNELNSFVWLNSNKAAAEKGKNDDLVMSFAIACWIFQESENQNSASERDASILSAMGMIKKQTDSILPQQANSKAEVEVFQSMWGTTSTGKRAQKKVLKPEWKWLFDD